MTTGDLKDLLQTMAAGAAESVGLDESTLVSRIRTRRRRRYALTTATGASAVAVIAIGAYAVLPGGADHTIQPPVATPTTTTRGVPLCGTSVRDWPQTDSPLRLAVTQKQATVSADGWSAAVQTQLTNTTGQSMSLTTSSSTAVVIVQNGVVISRGISLDADAVAFVLGPGQSRTFKSTILAERCDPNNPDGGGPGLEPRLPAGTYQVYGVHSYTTDPSAPGRDWQELRDGPWTIQLT